MSVQQRRKYDSGFKCNTIQLSKEPDRTVTALMKNLGIGKNIIYR